jgi:type IV pilus assembly protein PilC
MFKKKNIKIKSKWKRRDIIMFLERLEMYLSSGLEISKVLQISEEGLPQRQRNNISGLRSHVESGGTLSTGMLRFIGISKTSAGLVRHGESSGSLSKSLLATRSLLEKEDELYRKCTSAMAYPVVIGLFSVVLTIGLVRGVMTQIIPMLRSLHIDLPLITKVVIFLSETLTKWGIFIFVIIVFIVIIFRIFIKKSASFRMIIQSIIIKIPLAGRLFHDYHLAVFLHSCGALVESGLPVKEAYVSTVETMSLIPLRQFLEKHAPSLSGGVPLGSIIVRKDIPPYITALLCAGEVSGTLGSSIVRAGNILDRDIEHSLKKMTALIEPVMMVFMGSVVGAIAVSIMMPIYSISSVLQK